MHALPTVLLSLIGSSFLASAASSAPARRHEGIAESSWYAQVSQDISHGEYAFHEVAGEPGLWSAPNRSQGLRSRVSRAGLEVFPRSTDADGRGAAWKLSLSTKRFGRLGDLHELERPSIAVTEDRVELDHGVIREWFENEHRGIEHGWTIAARPRGVEPVWIGLEFGGDLHLRIDDGARSGALVDASGVVRLRYRDLLVFDAAGRSLCAQLRSSPAGAGIRIEDADALYPLTVDPLVTDPAWTVESDQASAGLGISVSTAGDVNGDGYSDVIVGAYLYDNGESQEGRAFAYLGSVTGLSTSPAWTAESDQAGANFGNSVAMAGDVNNDGYSDVIVGAPEYDNGQVSEGRAYVFLGSSSGLSASPAWTAESDQAFASFGNCVATAGDVNGDGFSDVIVGATLYSGGQISEGRAYAYLGSETGLSASPDWTAESDQVDAVFGNSVATAGDVNGDGYSDVIVGASSFDNPQADEGRAYAYLGSQTGLSPSPAWTVEGDQPGARFGNSVATAGDVDGDGYSDVIVGARAFDNGQTDEGRVHVYLGSPGGLATSPDWTAESDQGSALFGYSVATAGDVNADGYSDVIIGARAFDDGETDEGRAYAFLGSATGLAANPAWTAASDQASALFGNAVAPAGDVNGDGYSDVIVGAESFDDGETDEGRAYVYLGTATGLAANPAWTAESNQANASFGSTVSPAGDVNGDGFSDVIVGAYLFDNGQADEGRAYAYLGSATGLATSPAWTVESDQVSSNFGSSVGAAGDVNGDGYGDVIVGAYFFDNGETNEGRAFVYLGSAAGLSASPTWTAESNQANAYFGFSVAAAGDVNGDGFGDVIVGSQALDDGQTNEGGAFAFLGSASGPSASPAWAVGGNQASALFGTSVASAGDVNGDGYSDVIVGAYNFDNGQTNEGRAFAFLGSETGLSTSAAWTAESDQANASFGFSVATAGDVNGDGYSDVIVGASALDDGETDEGRAYAYLGSSTGLATSPAWMVQSNQASAALGTSVSSAGDVNGDGYSDVIVGAPSFDNGAADKGRAFTYLGSATGLSTTPAWIAESALGTAHFGISVASAGDVNGDGFGDVIVGAPEYSNGHANEGRAFLFLGKEGRSTWTIAARQRQASDEAPIALLGRSTSSTAFRIRLRIERELAGFAWAHPQTPRARLQWEVAPLDQPFDGTSTESGADQPVTGLPLEFNEPALFAPPAGGSTRRFPQGPYHWRARLRTNNPVLPVTPWVSIAGNNGSETKLTTRRVRVTQSQL